MVLLFGDRLHPNGERDPSTNRDGKDDPDEHRD
jgi:hypothetical protein